MNIIKHGFQSSPTKDTLITQWSDVSNPSIFNARKRLEINVSNSGEIKIKTIAQTSFQHFASALVYVLSFGQVKNRWKDETVTTVKPPKELTIKYIGKSQEEELPDIIQTIINRHSSRELKSEDFVSTISTEITESLQEHAEKINAEFAKIIFPISSEETPPKTRIATVFDKILTTNEQKKSKVKEKPLPSYQTTDYVSKEPEYTITDAPDSDEEEVSPLQLVSKQITHHEFQKVFEEEELEDPDLILKNIETEKEKINFNERFEDLIDVNPEIETLKAQLLKEQARLADELQNRITGGEGQEISSLTQPVLGASILLLQEVEKNPAQPLGDHLKSLLREISFYDKNVKEMTIPELELRLNAALLGTSVEPVPPELLQASLILAKSIVRPQTPLIEGASVQFTLDEIAFTPTVTTSEDQQLERYTQTGAIAKEMIEKGIGSPYLTPEKLEALLEDDMPTAQKSLDEAIANATAVERAREDTATKATEFTNDINRTKDRLIDLSEVYPGLSCDEVDNSLTLLKDKIDKLTDTVVDKGYLWNDYIKASDLKTEQLPAYRKAALAELNEAKNQLSTIKETINQAGRASNDFHASARELSEEIFAISELPGFTAQAHTAASLLQSKRSDLDQSFTSLEELTKHLEESQKSLGQAMAKLQERKVAADLLSQLDSVPPNSEEASRIKGHFISQVKQDIIDFQNEIDGAESQWRRDFEDIKFDSSALRTFAENAKTELQPFLGETVQQEGLMQSYEKKLNTLSKGELLDYQDNVNARLDDQKEVFAKPEKAYAKANKAQEKYSELIASIGTDQTGLIHDLKEKGQYVQANALQEGLNELKKARATFAAGQPTLKMVQDLKKFANYLGEHTDKLLNKQASILAEEHSLEEQLEQSTLLPNKDLSALQNLYQQKVLETLINAKQNAEPHLNAAAKKYPNIVQEISNELNQLEGEVRQGKVANVNRMIAGTELLLETMEKGPEAGSPINQLIDQLEEQNWEFKEMTLQELDQRLSTPPPDETPYLAGLFQATKMLTNSIKQDIATKEAGFSSRTEEKVSPTHFEFASQLLPDKLDEKTTLDVLPIIIGEWTHVQSIPEAVKKNAPTIEAYQQVWEQAEREVQQGRGSPYLTKKALETFKDEKFGKLTIYHLDDLGTKIEKLQSRLKQMIDNGAKVETIRTTVSANVTKFITEKIDAAGAKLDDLKKQYPQVSLKDVEDPIALIMDEAQEIKKGFLVESFSEEELVSPEELTTDQIEEYQQFADNKLKELESRLEAHRESIDKTMDAITTFRSAAKILEDEYTSKVNVQGMTGFAAGLYSAFQKEGDEIMGSRFPSIIKFREKLESASHSINSKTVELKGKTAEINLLQQLKTASDSNEAAIIKDHFIETVKKDVQEFTTKLTERKQWAQSFGGVNIDTSEVNKFAEETKTKLNNYLQPARDLPEGQQLLKNTLSESELIEHQKVIYGAIADGENKLAEFETTYNKASKAYDKFSKTMEEIEDPENGLLQKLEEAKQYIKLEDLEYSIREARHEVSTMPTLKTPEDFREFAHLLGTERGVLKATQEELDDMPDLSLLEQLEKAEETPGIISDNTLKNIQDDFRQEVNEELEPTIQMVEEYKNLFTENKVKLPQQLQNNMEKVINESETRLKTLKTSFSYTPELFSFTKTLNPQDSLKAQEFALWITAVTTAVNQIDLERDLHLEETLESINGYQTKLTESQNVISELTTGKRTLAAEGLEKAQAQIQKQYTTQGNTGVVGFNQFLKESTANLESEIKKAQGISLETELNQLEVQSPEYEQVLGMLIEHNRTKIDDYLTTLRTMKAEIIESPIFSESWKRSMLNQIDEEWRKIEPFKGSFTVEQDLVFEDKPLEDLNTGEFAEYQEKLDSLLKNEKQLEDWLPLKTVRESLQEYENSKADIEEKIDDLNSNKEFILAAELEVLLKNKENEVPVSEMDLMNKKDMLSFSEIADDAAETLIDALDEEPDQVSQPKEGQDSSHFYALQMQKLDNKYQEAKELKSYKALRQEALKPIHTQIAAALAKGGGKPELEALNKELAGLYLAFTPPRGILFSSSTLKVNELNGTQLLQYRQKVSELSKRIQG